ncbi:hypothetical protein [Brevundimonas sp. SL161]|uniref:hypothetical protein n=1 Tax=Brevundimonas sp. SL161 TaxID=2804613 RepID=UPI003CF70F8F
MANLNTILITVVGAVLGNAAVVAVIAIVARGLFAAAINRDLEAFKADLKSKGDAELARIAREAAREIESYKIKLKKSEFLFERQFQAANDMMKLFGDFSPQRSHPMMDWSDAMEEVVDNSGKTEQALRGFMVRHGAALLSEDREKLQSAITKANDIHTEDYFGEPDDHASELHGLIQSLRDSLIAKVQVQSSL